jgi:hypothetical protein
MTVLEIFGIAFICLILIAIIFLVFIKKWVNIMLKIQDRVNHKDEWGK